MGITQPAKVLTTYLLAIAKNESIFGKHVIFTKIFASYTKTKYNYGVIERPGFFL